MPPTNGAPTSRHLLRIFSTPGDAPSDAVELPEEAVEASSRDSRKVVGQRFPSMIAHADDEGSLLNCLEEQRRAKESVFHVQPDPCNVSNFATAVNVRIRGAGDVESALNLYCAACVDF